MLRLLENLLNFKYIKIIDTLKGVFLFNIKSLIRNSGRQEKSYASLGGFTHLQAPVSKAHLLFEQWLCRSHAFLTL